MPHHHIVHPKFIKCYCVKQIPVKPQKRRYRKDASPHLGTYTHIPQDALSHYSPSFVFCFKNLITVSNRIFYICEIK